MSASPSFIPWDIEVARYNFGANCGPASFAAATGREVCRVMRYFEHYEWARWTNLTHMKRAFSSAGYSITVQRCAMPKKGVALVQWLGPWTKTDFFSRWSLKHTHWIAIDGKWVFDHTVGEWQTLDEWDRRTATAFIAEIPQAGGWAVKYGVDVIESNSDWFGSDNGRGRSSCGAEMSLSS